MLAAALLELGFEISLTDDDLALSLPGADPGLSGAGLGARLLLVGGALSLAFRRAAPLVVLTVNALASLAHQGLAHQAFGYHPAPLPLALLVALYTVAVVRRPLIGAVAAAIYMLVLTAGSLAGLTPLEDDQAFSYLVSIVAAVMVGYGVALSRTRAALAEERAAEFARRQDARTQVALEQEQARIAREVHDLVAHDVSVMVAQARAARRVSAHRPQAADDALASIEAVGRDALDGLRRLVGLLRTEADRPERSPQPNLDRLPWLLAQVENAGLPVELIIRGRKRPLASAVELNAFRIVQEALTNSLKHAGPTHATVTLDYDNEDLVVEVLDGGQGDMPGTADGYGLIGMHQRVAMLGGDLVTEPEDGRGFRVAARLPVTDGAQ